MSSPEAAANARAPARAVGLTVDDYVDGVLSGNRTMVGRTITIIESRSPRHQELAQQILLKLLAHLGERSESDWAHRIGITGVPGVGKSTFIESFGMRLVEAGQKVAVLAVDPSSTVSGGSILGDKTRMTELAHHPNSFIRPSPSSGTLGGVARATRATMVVCEAAGFDVILVETVGAGQNEVAVAAMTDFFLVLMLPGAGDELQGIKKGVLEIADMLVINKADGDNEIKARQAAVQYQNALHIMKPASPNWTPPVLMCSSLKAVGIDEVWQKLRDHRDILTATGEFQEKRRQQRVRWMWSMLENQLLDSLMTHPKVLQITPGVEHDVAEGRLTVSLAVKRILDAYRGIDDASGVGPVAE
ncbi:MAG: methylmalonyl Co-A mutase-associated GTPase MeaB [Thiohalocapsa sp. PB-PSB1]|jgi:LAO/AO transport system kinase|nr:MAG: methylmalonyl Co-A mutase-associated GTPase MeaB [Thiohalocapsa sp. PB-PSB1]HCS88523.1 methylmalonyl Co-A mutase-associated GTPase MeaB [Chromatiaceae bacterium]